MTFRRHRIRHRLALALLMCIAAAASGMGLPRDGGDLPLSTEAQLGADIASAPCKSKERLQGVKSLFEKLGVPAEQIVVEKLGSVENVTVRIPGATPETLVVGAHYDKSEQGCGAMDNWSGIVTLAHCYRALQAMKLTKTIVLVAFGREEEGLLGSKAMVKRIAKAELPQYCAMINLDSFGMGIPQVLANASSKKLTQKTAEVAARINVPFAQAEILNADSDSSSFLSKKIPAVTLHGLANDYQNIIHTHNDKPEKVNPQSVYLGYRLALALLTDLDKEACAAYREK